MAKKQPPLPCRCCGFDFISTYGAGACPACMWDDTAEELKDTDPTPYRTDWMGRGMPWRSKVPEPVGWLALQCLAMQARRVSLSQVKGRPPKLN